MFTIVNPKEVSWQTDWDLSGWLVVATCQSVAFDHYTDFVVSLLTPLLTFNPMCPQNGDRPSPPRFSCFPIDHFQRWFPWNWMSAGFVCLFVCSCCCCCITNSNYNSSMSYNHFEYEPLCWPATKTMPPWLLPFIFLFLFFLGKWWPSHFGGIGGHLKSLKVPQERIWR